MPSLPVKGQSGSPVNINVLSRVANYVFFILCFPNPVSQRCRQFREQRLHCINKYSKDAACLIPNLKCPADASCIVYICNQLTVNVFLEHFSAQSLTSDVPNLKGDLFITCGMGSRGHDEASTTTTTTTTTTKAVVLIKITLVLLFIFNVLYHL